MAMWSLEKSSEIQMHYKDCKKKWWPISSSAPSFSPLNMQINSNCSLQYGNSKVWA